MRLIDADAIPYKKIMFEDDDFYYGVTQPYIDRMPTIDAVPVVRCRECKFFEPFRPHDGFCEISWMLNENDFFCKSGQRRADGDRYA